ncbi:MAG: ACT domain-containing protein, partial [Candidatus Micrarchaeota archaeon]
MASISDLNTLIRLMKSVARKGRFVFCVIGEERLAKLKKKPVLVFREREGITIVLDEKTADENGFSYDSVWSLITLSVHSDLSVVGFLAAVTNALAEAGISVNAVSAFH